MHASRPLALDLFSGQGGAARGYADAGFEILGIDIDPRMAARYPYEFHAMDWETALGRYGRSAALIHASPPCQHYSQATRNASRHKHPDLVPRLQERLRGLGTPYVIENVPGAPLASPLVLCGCMFRLGTVINGTWFKLRRPRHFEIAGFTVSQPDCLCRPGEPVLPVLGHGVPGWFYRKHGHGVPAATIAAAMGLPWMTREGVREAIPPAFTKYIAAHYQAAA